MIKYWITWAVAVLVAYIAGCLLGAEHAKASTCNQKIYDKLYYAVVQDALTTPVTCKPVKIEYTFKRCPTTKPCSFVKQGCETNEGKILEDRNKAIRLLRALCKGQLSTYERGFRK